MLCIRLLCAAYWSLLTVVLLVPNPAALFGAPRIAGVIPERGVHFVFFAVLGLVVQLSRFRVRGLVMAGLLLGYAVGVESLQWFVPQRSVELLDYLENLLGLAVGTGIWWTLRKLGSGRGKMRSLI